MLRSFNIITLAILLSACSREVNVLKNGFKESSVPPAPDYSKNKYWASLPTKLDAADSTPVKSDLRNLQVSSQADVFFIYPTIFTEKPSNQFQWNADVNDSILNYRIQTTTMLLQASIFNQACRVYAPYYRQAHLYAFFTKNKEDAERALNLAYEDVKAAFEYYLKNFNQGRPIIIASHSQGSYHAERLLRDYFDGKALYQNLVVAYLIGYPIQSDAFLHICPTESPGETGVWVSWNTFSRNYLPHDFVIQFKGVLSTNPLLWNSSEIFAPKKLNKGIVGPRFKILSQLVDAQNHQGILWISKPKIKGIIPFSTKSWHRADMNLFYMNIRENVLLRIEKFIEKEKFASSIRKGD